MGTPLRNLPTIALGDLRKDLGEVVHRATFAGQRTTVTRHGTAVAAIVAVEDLALLDELENRADLEALRAARHEDDGERISLDDFLTKRSRG